MEVLDSEDSRLFLFSIVDGIGVVCGNRPWGVFDRDAEADGQGEAFDCVEWCTFKNQW